MIGEANSSGTIKYLLCDGQGSVRHHSDYTGDLIAYNSCDTFAYDTWGHRVDPLKNTVNSGLFYTGEQWDSSAQMYYLRARYYNPSNGRFNQTDPFAGNSEDPQSLHKYLYCHANPVNGTDPSGMYGGVLGAVNIMAISLLFIGCVMIGANKAYQSAVEDAAEAAIKAAIATVVAVGMTLTDGWRWLRDQWERLKNKFKDREGIYLHYSFRSNWASLVGLGLWDIRETFCTRMPYPIGWLAKLHLALYRHKDPPDAVYIVWPRKGFGPFMSQQAEPQWDPYWCFWLPGGGVEYKFAKGSGGPGTVFGPIRIPPGSLGDFRGLIKK